MRGAQHYKGQIKPPPPVLIWSLYSGFTSFIAMAVIGMIHKYGAAIKDHNLPFAIAPTGASAVLLFAVPSSPLAQPRNVIIGHVIAAQMGVFMYKAFENVETSLEWLPGALAVGLAIFFMGLTNCYHPPAGATAYLSGYFSADVKRVGWWFPLFPVMPVVLIMVGVAMIVNNVCRVYPMYWFTTVHFKEHKAEAQLEEAVEQMDKVKDIKQEGDDDDDEGGDNQGDGITTDDEDSERGSGDSETSSCVVDIQDEVNSIAGNEGEAQLAWMQARIHELEHELNSLRAKHAEHASRHAENTVKHAKTYQVGMLHQ
ncbi:hypothetical protein LPJ64_000482 [Coemansia asiatica]|uniref:HPP transmembrane region domain-containing protein n=1 Tax=Coemansia asiatica TaxID=1052880 RepID=A0A9W7XMZ4_9FUNG|nr:hypothetical protein LPJ64_000482 [Coemansia asiatica]